MSRYNEGFIIIVALLSVLTFELFYFSLEPSITGYQLQTGDNSVVTRTLTTVAPNSQMTVQLNVTIDSAYEHFVYAIEEHVPNGWQIQSAPGGQIDGQIIKYSFIEENLGNPVQAQSRIFSYVVTAPSSGTHTFTGNYILDGMDNLATIQGNAQITVQECSGSETRSCTAANTCAGLQTCSSGTYGLCVAAEELCDVNCDGNEICTSNFCAQCECTAPQSCTTINGCEGTRSCIGGVLGVCTRTYNFCDVDCNGVQECTQLACPNCQCTEDEACLTTNGCAGTQTCTAGVLGNCQTTQNYCDSDCDGDQECVDYVCAACPCTGNENKSCTTTDGCQGIRTCNSGTFGNCISTQIFCDSNCDGTPECNDIACAACSCVEDWVCSGFGTCTDGTQTQTCTDSNSCGTTDNKPAESQSCTSRGGRGGGSSSGGSGGSSPPSDSASCNPTWLCKAWSDCSIQGTMTRTCDDLNNCGVTTNKPKVLDTCIYEPTCTDKIMNGNEQGIDCGGDCPFICKIEVKKEVKLQITSMPIKGEILDDYTIEATIKNTGEIQAENLEVMLDKWSDKIITIDNILPGDEAKITYEVNLPKSDSDTSVSINVFKDEVNLASKTVNVTLTIPKAKVKFLNQNDSLYPVIVLDNRGQEKQFATVEYQITKNKEIYAMDTINFETGQNKVYTNVMNNAIKKLPEGKYDIKTVFRSGDTIISESTNTLDVENDKKGINTKVLWYFILAIITISFIYVIFQKR